MSRTTLATLLALLVTAPAAATWYGHGTYEPDTWHDVDGGFQRAEATRDPADGLLYFNVHPTQYATGANANVAALGTRLVMPGLVQFAAMLGPWTDCNGDGYVGAATSALLLYPHVASDPTTCPVGSVHNDGAWVREYLPLGRDHANGASRDPDQLDDPEARVWGDWGLPLPVHDPFCALLPPHGTTSGTGWLLRYADCFLHQRVARTVSAADPTGALAFEDPEAPQRSSSLLNQHFPESLFGNPETCETGALQLDSEREGCRWGREERAFTTWDCSARAVEVRDATGLAPREVPLRWSGSGDGRVAIADDDGRYAWTATPAPQLHDPRHSFADGLDETFRGFHVGGRERSDDVEAGGDCNDVRGDGDDTNDYHATHAGLTHYVDSRYEGAGSSVALRSKSDIQFRYWDGDRHDPVDGVVAPLAHHLEPGWYANVIHVTAPQALDRQRLGPHEARYATFYATISNATIAAGYQPPGPTGVYGSEACPLGIGAGAQSTHGWHCDPARWYEGFGTTTKTVWDVTVGQTYRFRDVDCDDGTLARGSGVRASLVDLSRRGPCLDAP